MVIMSTIPVGYTESARKMYGSMNIIFGPEFSRESKELYNNPYLSQVIVGTNLDDERLAEACHSFAALLLKDMAEDDDKMEKVPAVNAGGTQNVADTCKAVDCKILYLSTDYVFDDQGTAPWKPDCKDYKPVNVYGQTKLEGELAVSNTLEKYFIVRIAWVVGLNSKNFIKTMIHVGKTHDEVRVVSDKIGTPTYTYDLARLLIDMSETEKYGYYHATNEGGYISWYDFFCEIYKQYGLKTKEIHGLSKAARPFNSRLNKKKLVENGFKSLSTWLDTVSRHLREAQP